MSNTNIPRIDDPIVIAQFDAWTRERIRVTGSFTLTAAGEYLAAFRGLRSTQQKEIHWLVEQLGDAVPLGMKRSGYTRTSCAGLPVTLAALVAVAERDYLDPDHVPESGRRATRDLAKIGPSQLTSIRVGAAAAAEMVTGDRRNLAGVGAKYLAWVSGAGEAGRGEWQIVLDLARWSDRDALDIYERKNGSSEGWSARQNADRRKKQCSGLRLALDLAATHGLLPRGGEIPDVTAPAASWEPQIRELYDSAVAAGTLGPGHHDAKGGVRLLALYATRLGYERHEPTDWTEVQRSIAADHAAGHLSYLQLSNARAAYNGILDAGLFKGDRWLNREDLRLSCFDHAVFDTTAKSLDFSEWRLKPTEAHPEPRYPAALIEGNDAGAYGLRGYSRWTRVDGSALASEGLPPRMWVNPTPTQRIKAAKDPRLFKLAPDTLAGRLRSLSMHLGWLEKERGIDWATNGVEAACDPSDVRAHLNARGKTAPDTTLGRLAMDLAVIASPYLEAQAVMRAESLRAAGDDEGAHMAEKEAERFKEWGTELRVIGTEHQSARTKRATGDEDGLSYRDIQEVWRAWTPDGRSGWHKLLHLRDLLIAEAERLAFRAMNPDADGRVLGADPRIPLDAQADAIAEGIFKPTLGWATTLRDAAVLTVVHRIPLRPGTLCKLVLDEWRAMRADGFMGELWEGAIHLHISAAKMKSKVPFQPPLILRDDLGDPDVLASVRHDLWRVYFVPGGALDELLRLPRGSTKLGIPPGGLTKAPWLFPAAARKGHARGQTLEERVSSKDGLRWKVGSYARTLKGHIRRHADVLRIDLATLDRIHGALTGHIVRHLFGSHHCDEQRWDDAIGLVAASKMLSHKSVEITESRYVGKGESDVSVGRRLGTQRARVRDASAATNAAPSPPPPGFADSLDSELARLQQMHTDGRLTAEEFEKLRAAAISRALAKIA